MPVSLSAFRIAQALGIGASTWLSGNIASISLFAAPALQRSIHEDSTHYVAAARQWKYTIEQGKPNPPTAAFASAVFAFCAWSVKMQGGPTTHTALYGMASLLTFGMIPYTLIWIFPINKRVSEIAGKALGDKESTSDKVEVNSLLARWTTLNWIRSTMPLTAALVAFLVTVLEVE